MSTVLKSPDVTDLGWGFELAENSRCSSLGSAFPALPPLGFFLLLHSAKSTPAAAPEGSSVLSARFPAQTQPLSGSRNDPEGAGGRP